MRRSVLSHGAVRKDYFASNFLKSMANATKKGDFLADSMISRGVTRKSTRNWKREMKQWNSKCIGGCLLPKSIISCTSGAYRDR